MVTIYVGSSDTCKFLTIQRIFRKFYDCVDLVAMDVEPNTKDTVVSKEEIESIANEQILYLRAHAKKYDYLISYNKVEYSNGRLDNAVAILIEDSGGKQKWGISRTVEYSTIKALVGFECLS